MDCNGGAEKKTCVTAVTLELKPSRDSPTPGCGLRSPENGTVTEDKEKTDMDASKGQLKRRS